MTIDLRSRSLYDLELSVRAYELLSSLGIHTFGQLLDCPRVAIPEEWPRKIAQLVAKEILMICEELGEPYEGEVVVPPPTPAKLQATGTVSQRWATIRAWLEEEHLNALDLFRSGATPDAIAAAEVALGVTLPEDYRSFLLVHDGQEEGAPMVRLGSLLPVGELVEARQGIFGEDTPVDPERVGEGVRAVDYSDKWIPISRSARGRDFLCIDLDPGPGGTMGQIIEYVVDSDERPLVAKSFADLLSLYFEQAQTGELDLDPVAFDEDDEDEG